ncbi:hypothetical protein HanRHA438_Chr04g0176251 [Helianthus annuus]|uniref:Uncharacterized protein n=1 Tax=Helianthus annuus TaxID=4232 RepID=A0A251V064_HELAN|nr:hypothetical protein HanXRQr2_Chr04g0166621 [Helianthus annuus]KAJ0588868.1 hypothetical protein HanIR_Chr04g0179671 [Helianthus annuus]KAJ0926866.1 hypothetical protein HanRHA438_Chr04g0176251 [Helianthus annuus]KAJ0931324.1 hypothetical protein HanPSC8_Chr04g0160331 [Helianthus annuus]
MPHDTSLSDAYKIWKHDGKLGPILYSTIYDGLKIQRNEQSNRKYLSKPIKHNLP